MRPFEIHINFTEGNAFFPRSNILIVSILLIYFVIREHPWTIYAIKFFHSYSLLEDKLKLKDTFWIMIFIFGNHRHQSVLPKGRSFTGNPGTKAAVLLKAGLPPQTQEPKLQFYQGWIGAVAWRCFPHTTPSLASEHTLKDLKRSQGHQRGGQESGFGKLGPPDFTKIHIMAKIIHLSWNPNIQLLYISWNFYKKILNILLWNLMCMGHFVFCI